MTTKKRIRTVLTLATVVMAIVGLAATSANAGDISYVQVTNDADSGISAEKTYTHAIDFGSSGAATVGGVVFTTDINVAAGGRSNSGTRTYGPSKHGGNTPPAVSGNIASVFTDMRYNGPDLAYIELTGLANGWLYDVRLYERAWDYESAFRTFYAGYDVGSDGSVEFTTPKIDQNRAALTPPGLSGDVSWAMSYVYQADASGKIKIIIDLADDQTGTYHLYGLTNETIGPADANAPDVDAGVDMISWSGQGVLLDPNIVEAPGSDWTSLTYLWSADDPCAVFDPSADVNDPTVTIIKPALTLTAVTIVNPGFENPVLADGTSTSTPPGWTDGYYDLTAPGVWVVGDADAGAYNPAAGADYGGVAPEGDNLMYATSGAGKDSGMSQVLSATLQANTQYDLSALVGNPFLFNGSTTTGDYRIELLAGGVVLASDTGASPADDTTWTTASLTYNSGASPAQLGEALEIRLLAVDFTDGKGVDFDDVWLTAEGPTPDPYSVTLTLAVNNEGQPPEKAVDDTMTIDVYDDACEAARIGKGLAADNAGDFDGNCITDANDLGELATKWLDDTGLTAPVTKP